MRDRAGLDAYIEELHDRNSPNYHQWLTPVEIAKEFGPSQGDYDAVVAWLQGQGIRVTQTFNHRLVIMASTTADVVSRVFEVSFGTFNYNNQMFIAAANEPSLPAQFSGIVSSITGLDTYYGLASNHAHRETPVGQAGPNALSPPYIPANIRTAYNLPFLVPVLPTGVAMGVLSACEASTTDLNGFASTYLYIPSYTLNTNYFRVAVNSLGGGSDPPTDPEPTLDLEWSHAIGSGANLYFYFDNNVSGCGSNAGWSFSGSIAAAAKVLADNLVQTWSTSWGCSEDYCYNSAARGMQDTEYASMVAVGMTGFVATGDNGAYANGDKFTLDVQFPGSDPNIIAVGGTTLTINNDGSYGSENGLWCPTCYTHGWGGGGGNSVTFTKPSWQSGVTGVSKTGRGLPDVSLDMDFHYPIYYGGAISTLWGGTSFAAPEWNGIMATIIYATTQPTSRFGNINYNIYSATSTSLWTKRDVTTGANGYTSSCGGNGQPQCGYSAGLGWDYATGWGSLDGISESPVELTTNVASGSGSVSPVCPSGCSEAIGSSITVTANPSANWQFSSWSVTGASCLGGSSINPCAFTMPNNAVTVSATFTQQQVTMTVSYSIVGGGTPSRPIFNYVQGGGSHTYTLTTTPTGIAVDSGTSWSVGPNPLTGSTSAKRWESNQPLSGTASGSTIAFVFYKQSLYTLSYSVVGGGSGYSAPGFTANAFGASSPQTLTTTPAGYWFDAAFPWTVTNPLSGSTSTEEWVTGSASGTIGASQTLVFSYQHKYWLSTQASPSGEGTVSPGSGWRNAGASVTVKATPNTGFGFSSWTGTGSGSYSGTSKSAIVVMNGPVTETANFGLPQLTVTLVNPTNGASVPVNTAMKLKAKVTSSGLVIQGATVTIYVDGNQVCFGTTNLNGVLTCSFTPALSGHVYSWYATSSNAGFATGTSQTWTFHT